MQRHSVEMEKCAYVCVCVQRDRERLRLEDSTLLALKVEARATSPSLETGKRKETYPPLEPSEGMQSRCSLHFRNHLRCLASKTKINWCWFKPLHLG